MTKIITNRNSKSKLANSGIMMKIIEYRRNNDFDVQFEDGTIVNCKRYRSFVDGNIAHPTMRLSGKNICKGSKFGTFQITKKIHNSEKPDIVLYACKCNKCNFKGSLTPSEMLQHKCESIEDSWAVDNTMLKDYCSKFGISYIKAQNYKNIYPQLSDADVIIHFRPDCYINIFGELIDPTQD